MAESDSTDAKACGEERHASASEHPADGLLLEKMAGLEFSLARKGSLAVAFSGGVDSSLLLAVAARALPGKVLAVMAESPLVSQGEVRGALSFCKELGVPVAVVSPLDLADRAFSQNPPDRCYLCKSKLIAGVVREAARRGFPHVAEGSNADDAGDYRPGFRAVCELGVASPLLDAGLSKREVRALARRLGLSVWGKPASACLASRFPYGCPVTEDGLQRVAAAEGWLRGLGMGQVRVRVHGDLARIEADDDGFEIAAAHRGEIVARFLSLGYRYVSLDLQGYRTGSMNEGLPGR